MIDLDKDIEDRDAYPLVAEDERWIFNKLILAEKLGHTCGPCGMDAPAGQYCIRPIMNVAGNGMGGVRRMRTDGTRANPLDYAAGYFWCEWFTGEHVWTHFTNDVALDECFGTPSGRQFDYDYRTPTFVLPPLLQGLSKHLVVEHIGGNIIEVSPRHMPYIHGRGNSFFRKYLVAPPWGNDEDWFYWRVLQK